MYCLVVERLNENLNKPLNAYVFVMMMIKHRDIILKRRLHYNWTNLSICLDLKLERSVDSPSHRSHVIENCLFNIDRFVFQSECIHLSLSLSIYLHFYFNRYKSKLMKRSHFFLHLFIISNLIWNWIEFHDILIP